MCPECLVGLPKALLEVGNSCFAEAVGAVSRKADLLEHPGKVLQDCTVVIGAAERREVIKDRERLWLTFWANCLVKFTFRFNDEERRSEKLGIPLASGIEIDFVDEGLAKCVLASCYDDIRVDRARLRHAVEPDVTSVVHERMDSFGCQVAPPDCEPLPV